MNAEPVSVWLAQVKEGNDEAANRLWERYFPDLVNVARQKLGTVPRRIEDEEDVALSALDSFFRAVEKGRFPDLEDRDGLWRLLSWITQRKAVDAVRRTLKQKSGGGQVRGESKFLDKGEIGGLEQAARHDLSPFLAIMVADECRHLLKQLDDDQLSQMALAKLEGYTNDEIAARQDCSIRTVERRLQLIRRKWESYLDAS